MVAVKPPKIRATTKAKGIEVRYRNWAEGKNHGKERGARRNVISRERASNIRSREAP